MQTNNVITDYFGATYFIEKNKEKNLIIFCVDENTSYLDLLKNILERPNFYVFTFSLWEECMEYLELKPNLVILDSHLNRVNPYFANGDKIAELIQQKVPEAKMILLSSDNKFNLLSALHISTVKNILY
jgi:two-component SAPR family response regulator